MDLTRLNFLHCESVAITDSTLCVYLNYFTYENLLDYGKAGSWRRRRPSAVTRNLLDLCIYSNHQSLRINNRTFRGAKHSADESYKLPYVFLLQPTVSGVRHIGCTKRHPNLKKPDPLKQFQQSLKLHNFERKIFLS